MPGLWMRLSCCVRERISLSSAAGSLPSGSMRVSATWRSRAVSSACQKRSPGGPPGDQKSVAALDDSGAGYQLPVGVGGVMPPTVGLSASGGRRAGGGHVGMEAVGRLSRNLCCCPWRGAGLAPGMDTVGSQSVPVTWAFWWSVRPEPGSVSASSVRRVGPVGTVGQTGHPKVGRSVSVLSLPGSLHRQASGRIQGT